MAAYEVLLTFKDFQRMLNENNARPVYAEVPGQHFELKWTSGAFIYRCTVGITEIVYSYKTQFKDDNQLKAIELFKNLYLKDCYRDQSMVPVTELENIPLLESQNTILEASKKSWKVRDFDSQAFAKSDRESIKIVNLNAAPNRKILEGSSKKGNKTFRIAVLEKS